MSRPALLTQVALLAGVLIVVAACGGGASPSPSNAAVAPSTAVASAAPSTASVEPSSPAASEAAPSVAIPSFTLPSSDKEIEALLPDKLCGKAVLKTSVSGAQAVGTDEDTQALIRDLGKSPADVSLAIAFPDPTSNTSCKVAAGIFRVKGANADQLATAFKGVAQKQGEQFDQRSLAGKNLYVSVDKDKSTTTYAYFNGDAFLFVTAPNDAAAGPVLQDMP
jgi:hypothetical protein